MMRECGKPNARVTVLTSPRTQGYEDAKSKIVEHILDAFPQYDLMLFLCDADGKDRSAEFRRLEANADERGRKLLCCAAVQELETWLLAGHLDKLPASWEEIRNEISVKERYFEPFLSRYGDYKVADDGRGTLMKTTIKHYLALLQRCPELAELRNRIRAILE